MIYDASNYQSLLGQTREAYHGYQYDVHSAGGEKRYLSWMPTKSGRSAMSAAVPFRDAFPVFSRDEIFDRVKAQESGTLISIERYEAMAKVHAHDQDGLPTCWANGPAHAFTVMRVIMGMPLVYISACSLAVPISGGHVGGDEWDAGQYLQKYGGASFDAWSNNDTSRSLDSDPKVVESRKHHLAFQLYQFTGSSAEIQLQLATAYTMDRPMPCAFAYFWWSHVIFGGRIKNNNGQMVNRQRNNWGDSWGAANEYDASVGGGYVELAEGSHGTPGSGFAIGPVLESAA